MKLFLLEALIGCALVGVLMGSVFLFGYLLLMWPATCAVILFVFGLAVPVGRLARELWNDRDQNTCA